MLTHLLGAPLLAIGLCLGLPQRTRPSPPAAPARSNLGSEVPLSRMPGMGSIGTTAGVSFLDYDRDGWPDLYLNLHATLWRNLQGTAFARVADLDAFLPAMVDRYGAACGDYDNDGLPDIACEPRDDCLYILRNLGALSFLEITADPGLLLDPPPCGMWAETFCWGDVDEDGDIDLWATAYQDLIFPGSGGNRFYENLGPTGPEGAHRFGQRTLASGLFIPPAVSRPEGAQFVDADRDGDLDGFANGTLYRNLSSTGVPFFERQDRPLTGIRFASTLDEGLLFFDHDLDGDQDLLVLYSFTRNIVWDNQGDGTFARAHGLLELEEQGATVGVSAEDWDLDGDLDMTTGHVLRRNLLVEGERFFRLATHSIPESELTYASPAWADWDKDGDPDCLVAGWHNPGTFYRNDSYSADTPPAARHSLRVRTVGDSASVPQGLENEFGATVEVRVQDDPSGFVRRRFVASSHGYLQQSEYALTLALPPGPDPLEPASGIVFDLLVDFPSLPENGILRIDRDVNPVLGGLELAGLAEREITVFRSGTVRIDGGEYAPRAYVSKRLGSTGALVTPRVGAPIDPVQSAPASHWIVGLELDTGGLLGPARVVELVLDGQLAQVGERCSGNVELWDVTRTPLRVRAENLHTSTRNDRSLLPLAWALKPARTYRVLCHVTQLRASPLAPPVRSVGMTVHGGLSFQGPGGCLVPPLASVDPASAYLELRVRTWEASGAKPAGSR